MCAGSGGGGVERSPRYALYAASGGGGLRPSGGLRRHGGLRREGRLGPGGEVWPGAVDILYCGGWGGVGGWTASPRLRQHASAHQQASLAPLFRGSPSVPRRQRFLGFVRLAFRWLGWDYGRRCARRGRCTLWQLRSVGACTCGGVITIWDRGRGIASTHGRRTVALRLGSACLVGLRGGSWVRERGVRWRPASGQAPSCPSSSRSCLSPSARGRGCRARRCCCCWRRPRASA